MLKSYYTLERPAPSQAPQQPPGARPSSSPAAFPPGSSGQGHGPVCGHCYHPHCADEKTRPGEVKSLVQSHKLLNPWETPILMGSRALSPDSLLSDRGGMCLPLELPIHLTRGAPKKTDDHLCGKGGMGSAFKFTFESTPEGENSLLY